MAPSHHACNSIIEGDSFDQFLPGVLSLTSSWILGWFMAKGIASRGIALPVSSCPELGRAPLAKPYARLPP
jgi:hypothetical protein